MAKKVNTTTKKTENKDVETEVINNPIPTVEEIKESIEAVNVEIPVENTVETVEEKIAEMLAPVMEITKEVESIGKTDEDLNEMISKKKH